MRYQEMVKHLKKHGFYMHRQAAGAHQVWHHNNGSRLTISFSGLIGSSRKKWLSDVARALKN